MPDFRVLMERVINGYRMCAGYPKDHIDAVPNKTLNDELTTGHRRRLPATSGFTQQRSGSPVTPAMRLSAAISVIPLRLLTDALAIWGTITAFGSFNSSLV